MLRALKKATDFINEHPDEAAEIIAKETQLDVPQVKEIMGKNMYSMVFDDHFVQACDEMAGFMLEMKNIPSKPAFDQYADKAALKAALPDLMTAK